MENRQQEAALFTVKVWRKRISTGMDQILPGLFVGGLRDAIDGRQLEENQIRAIVSVHGFTKDCDFAGATVDVLRVVLNDAPGENVLKHFPNSNSFIHAHRLKLENVLVHCLAGASRSVCFCLAYLMTVTNLDYTNALEFVSQRRYCARPNFGFKMQLMKYGDKYLCEERQRLFAEFAPLHQEDFIRLYRNDCLSTNSLFVEGAKHAELHFGQVGNGNWNCVRRRNPGAAAGGEEEGSTGGKANKILEKMCISSVNDGKAMAEENYL